MGVTVNMVSGGLLRTTDASAATPDAVFDMIAGADTVGPSDNTRRHGRCSAVFCKPLGACSDGTKPCRGWWPGLRLTIRTAIYCTAAIRPPPNILFGRRRAILAYKLPMQARA